MYRMFRPGRVSLAVAAASVVACSGSTEPTDDGAPRRIEVGGNSIPLLAASAERLYVQSALNPATQSLEARRLDGGKIWEVSSTGCGNECFLAVDADDNVYSSTASGITSRTGSSGDVRWSSPTGRMTSIAVGTGRVYAASRPFAVPQRVHALDAATGQALWIRSLLPGLDATAMLLDETNSTVYAIGRGRATAMNTTTGNIRWTTANTCFGGSQGAIAADGTVYITCDNDNGSRLFASKPDGELKWIVGLGPATGTLAPVIDAAGGIYVANSETLTALTPDGAVVWQLAGLKSNRVSPAVGSNGDIYLDASQTGTGTGSALVVNGGTVTANNGVLGCAGSFLLIPQGRIYCAVPGGFVVFQSPHTDITGQWSQLGRDALRSARKP